MSIKRFVFVILCGLFCAWIGNLQPFTPEAGFYSAGILFIAGIIGTYPT